MKKKILYIMLFILVILFGVSAKNFYHRAADASMAKGNVEDTIKKDTNEKNKTKGGSYEEESIKKENKIEQSQSEKEDIRKINIIGVGDIMCHSPQYMAAYNQASKTYDFNDNYRFVKPIIESADIAFANYETRSRNNFNFSGYPRFNSPKEILEALKNTGFDVISTANNHSMDMELKGLKDTVDNVENLGLINIGTFKDHPDKRYKVIEKNGIKIGLMCYTYGLNGLEPLLQQSGNEDLVNLIDANNMIEDIHLLKEKEKVDLTILYLHMGNEYETISNQSQRDLVNKLFSEGLDIVYGSHPHVVQEAETVNIGGKNHYVIYSMGNYISNQRQNTMGNSLAEDGLMVGFTIKKDFNKNITTVEDPVFYPTWVLKRTNPKLSYAVIPLKEALKGELDGISFTSEEINRMRKSYDDTIKTITQRGLKLDATYNLNR